jgi:dTDP-glucose pyrophosphorylase
MGYITADDVMRLARSMASNQYGQYLLRLVEEESAARMHDEATA